MEEVPRPGVRARRATSYPEENGVKKKILLVDDVKLFIELEKTFFQRKESFEVLTASSGKEALELAASRQPDLIFMDLYMPEMNGDECCRLIKESEAGREIPIVMVTSAGSEEDRAQCLAAGCDEILNKPINRSQFLSISKKYLEIHERKEPRYAVHLKISFGEEKNMVLSEYSVNLNTGGLFLTSSTKLPVHTRLFMEFSLPETQMVVNCEARVAWVNDPAAPLKSDLPAGLGLQFVDISAAEIAVIEQYIEHHSLTPEW